MNSTFVSDLDFYLKSHFKKGKQNKAKPQTPKQKNPQTQHKIQQLFFGYILISRETKLALPSLSFYSVYIL